MNPEKLNAAIAAQPRKDSMTIEEANKAGATCGRTEFLPDVPQETADAKIERLIREKDAAIGQLFEARQERDELKKQLAHAVDICCQAGVSLD